MRGILDKERFKNIQAKVSEQPNSSDCGYYSMHYVDGFLDRTHPLTYFSNPKVKWHFSHQEIADKRKQIRKVIENIRRADAGMDDKLLPEPSKLLDRSSYPMHITNLPMKKVTIEEQQIERNKSKIKEKDPTNLGLLCMKIIDELKKDERLIGMLTEARSATLDRMLVEKKKLAFDLEVANKIDLIASKYIADIQRLNLNIGIIKQLLQDTEG